MADGWRTVLPCTADSAGRSRRELREWLTSVCTPCELCEICDDLVFAVSEAVTNCIDHAYRGRDGGAVTVRGTIDRVTDDGAAVVVHVADEGRWQAPPEDPGDRGRGLTMMRACVEEMDVQVRRSGTTVTFRQSLGCGVPVLART